MSVAQQATWKQGLAVLFVLGGAICLVLALAVAGSWIHAEVSVRPYLERGIPLTATVSSKEAVRQSNGKSGSSTTYFLNLSYSYYLREGQVCTDCAPALGKSSEGVFTVTLKRLKEHVYYPSWQALQAGDAVAVVVLPEDPERVLLASFVDRSAPRPPLLQLSWAAILLIWGCVGLGLFKLLGGKF